MQLGLATQHFKQNWLFNVISYASGVTSIIFILVVLAYSLFVSSILVVYDVSATLPHLRRSVKSCHGIDPRQIPRGKVQHDHRIEVDLRFLA